MPEKTNNNLYYFHIADEYTLGTPDSISDSERTVDVLFHDFAQNYDLQTRLKLASTVFIKPVYGPPLAYPMQGQELIESVARYLAVFTEDKKEKKLEIDYLVNNGLVRILALNEELLNGIKQDIEKVKASA